MDAVRRGDDVAPPTPDQVRAAVESYGDLFNRGDREGWVALFAPGAEHHDPVGSPANVGRDAIAAFWDSAHQLADRIVWSAREVLVCGDEAAVPFSVTAHAGEGAVAIDGIEIFTVTGEGEISRLKAYWDASKMRPVSPAS